MKYLKLELKLALHKCVKKKESSRFALKMLSHSWQTVSCAKSRVDKT